MQTPMKIAVAGATGRVGRHVVDVLKGDGQEVVAISRSNGVDVITGAGLAEALVAARILRAAQFHEFVGQLVDWGTQGDTAYVQVMRTQLVSARMVAVALAALATDPASAR